MPNPIFTPLLNPPAFPADGYARLADRLKRLLFTDADLVFVQAEAILALEAVATSIARPGLTAINIVTSPYGTYFGAWLRRGGVAVHDLVAEPGQPIQVAAFEAAIAALPSIDIVAIVHGEAANGALNPLPEIAALAKAREALIVVDAVASVGAHALEVDAFGLDLTVFGPQKGLGGPPGLSAILASDKAWRHIAATPGFSPSSLSLSDIKRNWLDTGRGILPGMPSPLEFWALEAALGRIEAEGIQALIARHALAARASRAGLRALGLAPWIADDAAASALVTAALVPVGIDAEALIAAALEQSGVALGRGFGDISGQLVRLDHTGIRAAFAPVLANVVAYGSALQSLGVSVDIGAGAAAVAAIYAAGASAS